MNPILLLRAVTAGAGTIAGMAALVPALALTDGSPARAEDLPVGHQVVTIVAQTQAQTQAEAPAGLSAQDQTFMAAAARGSEAHVQLGRLAVDTTGDTEIKALATRLVHDHRQIAMRLRQLAEPYGLQLPDRPTLESQEVFDRLNGLSDTPFDRSYLEAVVKDNETAVALFAKEQQSGRNADVRSFAEETLPILKAHLEEARRLASGLPGS